MRRDAGLTANADHKKRIESLALTLEREELAAKGVADQVLFNRAIELDPDNGRAKDALGRLARGEIEKKSAVGRWGGTLAIALGALIAIVLIALRRGKPEPAPAPPPAPAQDEAEAGGAPAPASADAPEGSDAAHEADLPAPAGKAEDEDQK